MYHEGSGFSSTMNEVKEKITNSKDISEGKSMKGKDVDSNTDEIKIFAKSISDKINAGINLTFKNQILIFILFLLI